MLKNIMCYVMKDDHGIHYYVVELLDTNLHDLQFDLPRIVLCGLPTGAWPNRT